MTLTPERIAEIEGLIPVCVQDGVYLHLSPMEATELCRLARLGLRVEGAPTCSLTDVNHTVEGLHQFADTIASLDGKRVALVVTDE